MSKKNANLIFYIICWISLFLTLSAQLYIMLNKGNSFLFSFLLLSRFFTIQTNFLLFLIISMKIWGEYKKKEYLISTYKWSSISLVYIVFVAIVYHVLLMKVWNPQGFQWYVGEMLHKYNPILFFIFWWITYKKEVLPFSILWKGILFPLFYFCYAIGLGLLGLGYPYPFLNPDKIGWLALFAYGIALLAFFCCLMFILIMTSIYVAGFKKKEHA